MSLRKITVKRPLSKVGMSISKSSLESYITMADSGKCGCCQVYIGGQRNYTVKPFSPPLKEKLCEWCNQGNKRLIVHCPIHINLGKGSDDGSSSADVYHIANSKECLMTHVTYLTDIPARMVLHPGKHLELERSKAITNITTHLNEIHDSLPGPLRRDFAEKLCLENAAGQGTEIGFTPDDLWKLSEGINFKVNFCLDTQHAFAAGWTDFDDERSVERWLYTDDIGERVKVVHLNDSLKTFGSRVDRHASFGEGLIWSSKEKRRSLRKLLRETYSQSIDVVLETPHQEDDLRVVESLG